MQRKEIGKLYICPTPIGNLEDITIRTLKTLQSVDIIMAEDTRNTIKLLNHYQIKKPLKSYHEHNKKRREQFIIDRLLEGENIALVSDAGMPGISDPGEDIIRVAVEEGIDIVGLPGPSASLLALVISGIRTDKFTFEGFLSSKRTERLKEIEKFKDEEKTIIIYESPHRILKTLNDLKEILGNRKIALGRELTKKYEEINRGKIDDVIREYEQRDIKGEIVLILEGKLEEEKEDISIEEELKKLIELGYTKKDAVKKLVKEKSLAKNEVYKYSLKI